jgi:hypothetical protein
MVRDEVYKREFKTRYPIELLFGPDLAREARRRHTSDVFKDTARDALQKRLAHEIGRILPKGAEVSAGGDDGNEG